MIAIKKSEASFRNSIIIDLVKNKKLYTIINVLSLLLGVFFYIIFYYAAKPIVVDSAGSFFFYFKSYHDLPSGYEFLFLFLIFIMMVLHEAIHGVFFFLFTGAMPVFGFKKLMAYAGAPDWYVKKNYYIVITMAPFVTITLLGFLLLFLIPAGLSSLVFLPTVINAAGCVGDFWYTAALLNKPKETYITDSGTVSVISFN